MLCKRKGTLFSKCTLQASGTTENVWKLSTNRRKKRGLIREDPHLRRKNLMAGLPLDLHYINIHFVEQWQAESYFKRKLYKGYGQHAKHCI